MKKYIIAESESEHVPVQSTFFLSVCQLTVLPCSEKCNPANSVTMTLVQQTETPSSVKHPKTHHLEDIGKDRYASSAERGKCTPSPIQH